MKHIISLGEVLIDLIPCRQVHLTETCYTPYPGGAIANVAVAIARLGGSSRFTRRVGSIVSLDVNVRPALCSSHSEYTLVQQGCTSPSDLVSRSENDLNNLGNFASFVAGLSVTSYGGMSSFPFIYEVNDFSSAQEQRKEQSGAMQG